jgi:hypothetical protein
MLQKKFKKSLKNKQSLMMIYRVHRNYLTNKVIVNVKYFYYYRVSKGVFNKFVKPY